MQELHFHFRTILQAFIEMVHHRDLPFLLLYLIQMVKLMSSEHFQKDLTQACWIQSQMQNLEQVLEASDFRLQAKEAFDFLC